MKKKFVLALTLVLTISLLAACEQPVGRDTTPTPITDITEASAIEILVTEPVIDYSDRISVYDNITTYTAWYYETITNHFPIIELDGDRNNNMNSILSDYWTYCWDHVDDSFNDESKYFNRYDRYYEKLTYKYSICGNILSVIMCKFCGKGFTSYDVFNFYIPEDRLAEDNEVAAAFGLSADDIYAESKKAVFNYYTSFASEIQLWQAIADDGDKYPDLTYADYLEASDYYYLSDTLKEGVTYEDLYQYAAELSIQRMEKPCLAVYNGNLCVTYPIDGYFDDGDGVHFRECIFPYDYSQDAYTEEDVLRFYTVFYDD